MPSLQLVVERGKDGGGGKRKGKGCWPSGGEQTAAPCGLHGGHFLAHAGYLDANLSEVLATTDVLNSASSGMHR